MRRSRLISCQCFRRLAQEDGQVTVLAAFLVSAIFAALALVVDVGIAYEERSRLQSAVDAAALAGAMELAEGRGEGAAVGMAETYLRQNSAGAADPVIGIAGTRMTVIGRSERETYFARIFTKEPMRITARAAADASLVGKVYNLMPVIVPYQQVSGHVGSANQAQFEFGDDRPRESTSISYTQSGSRVTYTILYVNTGKSTVRVDAWSPVPVDALYVAGSADGGAVFDGANLRWSWPAVSPGDRRFVSYSVDLSGSANPSAQLFVSEDGDPARSFRSETAQKGFFWLTDFNSGANGTPEFASWIRQGYPDAVGIGMSANGTGVRASLKEALADRLAADPSVILPLFDYTQGGGSGGSYNIVGFAEFVMTGFNLNSNPKSITGYFTNGTVTTGIADNGNSALDFGVRTVFLVE